MSKTVEKVMLTKELAAELLANTEGNRRFKPRVGARYAEYHQASAVSDRRLGDAVVRHICEDDEPHQTLGQAVTVRAVAVANPLRDFLEDVDLVDA